MDDKSTRMIFATAALAAVAAVLAGPGSPRSYVASLNLVSKAADLRFAATPATGSRPPYGPRTTTRPLTVTPIMQGTSRPSALLA